jgi:hypothetical protein
MTSRPAEPSSVGDLVRADAKRTVRRRAHAGGCMIIGVIGV